MMERTDRDFRVFMRAITRETLLYTPMITAHALLRGPTERLLAFDEIERPLSLQLGGDDPDALARCARMAEARGYDEVNLNVGCPSPRVKRGRFGAILMRTPEVVAACVAAMRDAVDIPVTVKHRIGVDELDAYDDMLNFVDVVADAGCRRFTVHARKAWLNGLSPHENRTIPPLRHDEVARLKRERPALFIETNGGIREIESVLEHLRHVDAVMLGRVAWDRPMVLATADARVFDRPLDPPSARAVVQRFAPYAARRIGAGARPVGVLRNLLNVYAGMPGTKAFKRAVEQIIRGPGLDGIGLADALARACDEVESVADRVRRHRESPAATPA
jgi:tRNA-dihydrouridine synthase A